MLCGNPLPWVDHLKHLGNSVSNSIDGGQLDMKIKTTNFIDKSNQINQKFYFANPATKIELNSIYNSHFYGSEIWDLFSKGNEKIESSWNRTVKIIFDLPYNTHRRLIEPISGQTHIKLVLIKRLLRFVEKLKFSKKPVLRQPFSVCKDDVRTITGANLRNIMLQCGENSELFKPSLG